MTSQKKRERGREKKERERTLTFEGVETTLIIKNLGKGNRRPSVPE